MRLLTTIFIVASLALAREALLLPDGKMHIHMFDVGQGDSFFVVTPQGSQILIDGGPNLSALEHLGTVMPFFDRTIDLVVLTHPDADHITALAEVLNRYNIGHVLLTGVAHSSGRYEKLLETLRRKRTPVVLSNDTQDLIVDDVMMDIIWPTENLLGQTPQSQNAQSIVLRMQYGSQSILFTGDITEETERSILALGTPLQSTIMTVPHHGSKTSSSTGFLLSVQPKLGLASAGKHNRFGHPHTEVLQRYESFGIPIKTTATEGTVSIVLDAY